MRLIKYHHACVVLEEAGKKLVIDPGIYTKDLNDFRNITTVIITHKHADHFDLQLVEEIITQNPGARIFTVKQVADKLTGYNTTTVQDGDTVATDGFRLFFNGQLHASVHPEWPSDVQNIGVGVNDQFYYGGDSLTLPGRPVKVLAVPVSYAWMKMSEAMDYVATIKPATCFATHDNPLSEAGKRTAAGWISKVCQRHDIDFRAIKPGDSFEF